MVEVVPLNAWVVERFSGLSSLLVPSPSSSLWDRPSRMRDAIPIEVTSPGDLTDGINGLPLCI